MNILYITHYSGLYGANKSMFELIINMKEKYGVYPIVITPTKGELNNKLNDYGVENHVFKYFWWMDIKSSNIIKKKLKYLRYKTYNYYEMKKIIKFFHQKEINIIHTNSSTVNIGGMLSRRLNIPHLWHIREFGEEDYNLIYYNGIEKACNYIENSSTEVVCISNCIIDKYIKYFKDKSKLKLIYNGVNVQDYYINIQEKKFEDEFNILFTGLISKEKNQFELVKALNILINERKIKNINAYFLGDGDNSYTKDIISYIKKNNLENNIHLEGKVDNVKRYIEKCDIGVICSYKEAFGRVTVEYMLGGLTVIASNTGANLELIKNNSDGLIYEYGNPLDLSNKIEYLYFNRRKLKNISLDGQRKALNNFTSDINCKNIHVIYKNMINGI